MVDVTNTTRTIDQIRNKGRESHPKLFGMKWKWIVRIYDTRLNRLQTMETIHFEAHEERDMKDYIFWALTNKESWPTIHPSCRVVNITELSDEVQL